VLAIDSPQKKTASSVFLPSLRPLWGNDVQWPQKRRNTAVVTRVASQSLERASTYANGCNRGRGYLVSMSSPLQKRRADHEA
jgi:hypothetical protein